MSDQSNNVFLVSTGSYVPETVLTNKDLEKRVDTSDEWIVSRTGIQERRIAGKDESTSDLGTKAALKAIEKSDIEASEIDLIIVATVTPDMFFPSTACFIQKNIGAHKAVAFDVSAACSGYLYALQIAKSMLSEGKFNNALVVGAEKLSNFINWEDRNTCVLFGDGAGASILRKSTPELGLGGGFFLADAMYTDGEQTNILMIPGGGSAMPITEKNASERLNTVKMEGREVYKHAVTRMKECAEEMLENAGVKVEEVDLVVAHQANRRIIEAIVERLGVPEEKTFYNLQNYGNTSAASIAIALDEALDQGKIQSGSKVLFVAFGAGLTWAGSLMQWS